VDADSVDVRSCFVQTDICGVVTPCGIERRQRKHNTKLKRKRRHLSDGNASFYSFGGWWHTDRMTKMVAMNGGNAGRPSILPRGLYAADALVTVTDALGLRKLYRPPALRPLDSTHDRTTNERIRR